MDYAKLNRQVAEEVMGWREGNGKRYYRGECFGIPVLRTKEWDPCTRHDHAMGVVGHFKSWEMRNVVGVYYVTFYGETYAGQGMSDSWCMAIVLAALDSVKAVAKG